MGQKFSFFDLDENILHLRTPIYIYHKQTGKRNHIFPCDLSAFESGKILSDYIITDSSFVNFRDSPSFDSVHDKRQQLYIDLEESLESNNWQGPSWEHFKKAVQCGDPISIITARRHEPETITAALSILQSKGYLSKKPNFLAIFPVWNPQIHKELIDSHTQSHSNIEFETPKLKALALVRAYNIAISKYGESTNHRFGISDDDPRNILAFKEVLYTLKSQNPQHSFYLYDCSGKFTIKTEIKTIYN